MNWSRNNRKQPLLQAKIQLFYKTIKEAEAVAKAVTPDNQKVPQGLFIKTTKQGKRVFTKIQCETKLWTFIATIDDFLGAVSIAEKTLSAIKDFSTI
jgi:hypothetical protein